jgi:hypothetical protein
MPLSIQETAELCRLCREGMFIEVQEWVKSGKDTTPHPSSDNTISGRGGKIPEKRRYYDSSAKHC